ncbi:MAG: hypothetical protein ACLPYZ_15105 [Limisphaerales bacterium]
MADSKIQAQAEKWIRETWLPKHFNWSFHKGQLRLSSGGLFEFDAVSDDQKLIASISTNGGITAAGRKATPKLNKVRSDILFLLLCEANRRLVLLTDKAMFDLCEQERINGRMPLQVEFIHATLPPDLEEQCKAARQIAAQEQGYKNQAIKPRI